MLATGPAYVNTELPVSGTQKLLAIVVGEYHVGDSSP